MNAVEIYEKAVNSLERGDITLGEFETQIAVLKDVEPVVRCKDCQHAKLPYTPELQKLFRRCNIHGVEVFVNNNHFCSYGERRTDDE